MKRFLAIGLVAAILLVAAPAAAQSVATLARSAVGSGGGTATGGGFELRTTSGLPVVGTSTGGTVTLIAGFWGVSSSGVAAGPTTLNVPVSRVKQALQ